jgi:hypothetical protein
MSAHWLYFWWVREPKGCIGPETYLKSAILPHRVGARAMTIYDTARGRKVGRVHAKRIFMEAPPK